MAIPDQTRLGIFKEMGYHTIQDAYKSTANFNFRKDGDKGRQILAGHTKSRNATQAGYFTSEFGRVFDGEAYSDPIRQRRLKRIDALKKNIVSKPFVPSDGPKQMSGLGNHYGTLGGKVEHFRPETRGTKSAAERRPNVKTNPAKKGTGYGYLGVTLGKYPEYKPDTYDADTKAQRRDAETHRKLMKGGAMKAGGHVGEFFDSNPFRGERMLPRLGKEKPREVKIWRPSNPAKKDGGSKLGTIDVYPKHSEDRYVVKTDRYRKNIVNQSGKTFYPNPGLKSTRINSILAQNVDKSVNNLNARYVQSVMAY